MLKLIEEIIAKFGPRPAGTDAEKNAQLFIYNKSAELTDQREFFAFRRIPRCPVRQTALLYSHIFRSTGAYWLSPVIAFAISFVNITVATLDMLMYKDILTSFPGPKRTSSNVTATLEPQAKQNPPCC